MSIQDQLEIRSVHLGPTQDQPEIRSVYLEPTYAPASAKTHPLFQKEDTAQKFFIKIFDRQPLRGDKKSPYSNLARERDNRYTAGNPG